MKKNFLIYLFLFISILLKNFSSAVVEVAQMQTEQGPRDIAEIKKIEIIKPSEIKEEPLTLSTIKENYIPEKIGDKKIYIGIHGVGERDSRWFPYEIDKNENLIPKLKNSDIIIFKWKQGLNIKIGKKFIPGGFTDRDVIEAAQDLSNLILNIYEKIWLRNQIERKKLKPYITLIAHSMGGNVVKVALSLLNYSHQIVEVKKEPETIIGKIKKFGNDLMRTITNKQTPPITTYKDQRYKKRKILGGFTKRLYNKALQQIRSKIGELKEKGVRLELPLVEKTFTLGTPQRREFPFIPDSEVTKEFFALFSTGDPIQGNFGFSTVKVEDMFDENNNVFNIQVKIKRGEESFDPNHDQLIRQTSIIYKLVEINKEKIKEELENYLKKFDVKDKEDEKKKIKNILIIFPEKSNGKIEFSFQKERPKEKFVPGKLSQTFAIKI